MFDCVGMCGEGFEFLDDLASIVASAIIGAHALYAKSFQGASREVVF